jgi:hypothetical protein
MAADKDPEIERLASAVAQRFIASARTARLTSPAQQVRVASGQTVSVVERVASAVGQRLAARGSVPNIDKLASAVAHRLAASPAVAGVASAATRHFARTLTSADLAASAAAKRLTPPTVAKG